MSQLIWIYKILSYKYVQTKTYMLKYRCTFKVINMKRHFSLQNIKMHNFYKTYCFMSNSSIIVRLKILSHEILVFRKEKSVLDSSKNMQLQLWIINTYFASISKLRFQNIEIETWKLEIKNQNISKYWSLTLHSCSAGRYLFFRLKIRLYTS